MRAVFTQAAGLVRMSCASEGRYCEYALQGWDMPDGMILTAKKLPVATGWTTIVSTEAV
ncbi:MAG: hypothetical protein HGJ97_16840 [Desulfosporosinus sp.]|nr:hypothetical protein [Desulfosporosinus sp.]